MNMKPLALIFACSYQQGVEYCEIFPKSINALKFIDYLTRLRSSQGSNQRFSLFMDNLSVHKTKDVKKAMETLRIDPIYNVPYAPDFQPCEHCFSVLKNSFKRNRIYHVANKIDFDPEAAIK